MNKTDYALLSPSLPTEAGVYRFIANDGEILYIGKAKNLKKRLSSYFSERADMRQKTKQMVRAAAELQYTVVETEQDALLLEATLIRRHRPRYNIALKWTKPYPYIGISNENFPRVFYAHTVVKDGSLYFGPYTSKHKIYTILELIRNLFQLRNCQLLLSPDNIKANKFKPCLEYHIKNCLAPCIGLESAADYQLKIDKVADMLKGNFVSVKKYLQEQINRYAENMEFEKAHNCQNQLQALQDYQAKSMVVNPKIADVDIFSIQQVENNETQQMQTFVNYIKVVQGAVINSFTLEVNPEQGETQEEKLAYAIPELREKFQSIATEIIVPFEVFLLDKEVKITIPLRGDKKQLLDLSAKNLQYFILQEQKIAIQSAQRQTQADKLLETMQKDLRMNQQPQHIECFDNSNLQGTNPVAACVVFVNGKPSKRDYRHYHIKTVEGPNDFASMEEVVYRRYKRLLESQQNLPQLIVIDGGKGQLSSAIKSLDALGISNQVQVIGIAKKLEEIYFAGDNIPLLLSKKSPTLKVIQQIRDEAHRFGLTFHRLLRENALIQTELTQIEAVGQKTADKLIAHFGSVKAVTQATAEELLKIVNQRICNNILAYFAQKPATNIPELDLNHESNEQLEEI